LATSTHQIDTNGLGEFDAMKAKKLILVVSHDPQHADVRKRRLEEAGYEVVEAMDIQAVQKACASRKIDLTVVGHSLPPAEKRRVSSVVRQSCGNSAPIIQLSANELASLVDSTVIDHSPKNHNALAERVRQILEPYS
jgi:CheY-like chemotaxis protein